MRLNRIVQLEGPFRDHLVQLQLGKACKIEKQREESILRSLEKNKA